MTDKEKSSVQDEDTEEKASVKEEVSEKEGKRYDGGLIPRASKSKQNKD